MDPVIFDVVGPVKLRWYGMGYLLGFVVAYFILKWLARKNYWALAEEKVSDFIAYAAFFGVFVGGRLGFIILYQIPKDNWQGLQELIADPLMVIRVWDGGMSSHGGILGLTIFTLIYARKNKVSWAGVSDCLCVVGPLGVGFVRVANFINGELYGRVASATSWAVKFPGSMFEDNKGANQRIYEMYAECQAIDPAVTNQTPYESIVALSRKNPELLEVIGRYIEPRYPSQLYQALLEGFALFVILFFMRVKFRELRDGIVTGMFFILYAVFRIVVEGYREPDAAMVGSLTKGQFYSTFMVLVGIGFIVAAMRRKPGSI